MNMICAICDDILIPAAIYRKNVKYCFNGQLSGDHLLKVLHSNNIIGSITINQAEYCYCFFNSNINNNATFIAKKNPFEQNESITIKYYIDRIDNNNYINSIKSNIIIAKKKLFISEVFV